jgi:hypothetical protein
MAITQALCTSFKKELMEGKHNFLLSGGDTFKIALYTSSASLDASTTVYTVTNEVSSSGTNYTAGGNTLTNVDPASSGTVAYADFADVSFLNGTFTCRGALVYNSTNGNRAVMVLDFGVDKTVASGTFTITFPTADSSNAIIRIS